MKKCEMFLDEISGRQFDTEQEAIQSEQKNKDIQNAFSFYNNQFDNNDPDCKFGNGELCIQRSEEFYIKLQDVLINMLEKYESWIYNTFNKQGHKIDRKATRGILGRFLDDSQSVLYKWYLKINYICPICFREFGQMYYTNNCTHNGSIKTVLLEEEV